MYYYSLDWLSSFREKVEHTNRKYKLIFYIWDSGLNFFRCFKRWNSEKVKSIWTSRKTSYISPQKFAKIIIPCFTCVCYVPQKNLSFSQIDDMTQIICLTTYLLTYQQNQVLHNKIKHTHRHWILEDGC